MTRGRSRTASLLRRLAHRLPPAIQGKLRRLERGDLATFADLHACYRLILGRDPDLEGWRHFEKLVRNGGISAASLALAFLSSVEFRRRGLSGDGGPPRRSTLVGLDEFDIYVPDDDPDIGDVLRREGRYEAHVAATLRRLLRPSGVFVDVGANLGIFSLLAARLVTRSGKVIAIEPNSLDCALLHRSAARNGFGNVEIHQTAVAEQRIPVLYYRIGSNGFVMPFANDSPIPDGGELLYTTRLDDLLRDAERVDVMKIDVEGAEHRALAGAAAVIGRCRPTIVVEFSPAALASVSDVSPSRFLSAILSSGYELAVLDPLRPDHVPTSLPDPREIVERHRRSQQSHLDLLATPRP